MEGYEGLGKKAPYFEGWYCKHTGPAGAVALIPGICKQKGGQSAFIQLITEGESLWFPYPMSQVFISPRHFFIKIGGCLFTRHGVRVNLAKDGFYCKGTLRYGPWLTGPDVMGPLRRLPFLQCGHDVLSLGHEVSGTLRFADGEKTFTRGYLEKDCGRAFPKKYVWAQGEELARCGAGVVAAVAAVPVAGLPFTGFFARVRFEGRELLFATYLGGVVDTAGPAGLVVRQGPYLLTVHAPLSAEGKALYAPNQNGMGRTVTEQLAAPLRFQLVCGRRLLFDFVSKTASFEAAGWAPASQSK